MGARRCGCTFCRKHGGVWTSHPRAELTVTMSDRAAVSVYRFGTATADFLVCAVCGAVPVVVSEIDGTPYAVVNVNTLDLPEGVELSESATDFDAESTDLRLARRRENWIKAVRLEAKEDP